MSQPLTEQQIDNYAILAITADHTGERIDPAVVTVLVDEVRKLQHQRRFLLGRLARKDAASGEGDRALREFLGGEVSAGTAAPAPPVAPLAVSQPSEAPVEGETGERAATGRVGDSAPTADEGPGWCTFGEDDAPGAGCILPAGHQPPNRHLVTPGDTDDD